MFDRNMSIRDIIKKHPKTLKIFKKYKITGSGCG